MSILRARRTRLAVGAAVAAVASAVTLAPALPASAAALVGNIVVATPTTGKVAANTAKQVIMLNLTLPTGTTLTEDSVASVNLGAARCTTMEFYIVTGTSQIAAKTPDDPDAADPDGCAATASGTETIVVTFSNGDTLTKTGSNLQFVTPPAIVEADDAPVITDNSAGITDPDDQVKRLLSTGGQTVRIKAEADYTFNGGTAAGLAVTIGGKALTEVKAWSNATPPVVLAGAGAVADKGNFLTGKTAAGMTTSTPTVVITQNGVSKTFSSTLTGITVVTAPTITAINTVTVKAGVATTLTLTGTGFASGATATVCGVTATTPTPNSAGTSMTIVVPASGIVDDGDGLGDGIFSGSCPVVVTAGGIDSPINDKSMIAIVSE